MRFYCTLFVNTNIADKFSPKVKSCLATCPKFKVYRRFAALEHRIMKKNIIAIALCLIMCFGSAALASCTANTAGNGNNGTGTGSTATTETKAETKETESSVKDGAESAVDSITDGMRNRMGDPHFSEYPHRGTTPSGK